jgi:hypothetical protein
MTQGHPGDCAHEIFVSYAHENAGWIKALELDKNPASTENASFWVDKDRIHAGDSWKCEAQQALETAVLLISGEFLNSPSINGYELPAPWTSVVQPGIEYMKRKTEEIQNGGDAGSKSAASAEERQVKIGGWRTRRVRRGNPCSPAGIRAS